MKNYYVIATVWSDEYRKQIKKIQGQFDNFAMAYLFCKAYNNEYSAHAIVVDSVELINGEA